MPGNHDSSVFTEVIPESMDARRLAEQFCRLGRQRKGCFLDTAGYRQRCFLPPKGGRAETNGVSPCAVYVSGGGIVSEKKG